MTIVHHQTEEGNIFVMFFLSKMFLARDAWTREAQEASKLLKDIESRVKNMDLLIDQEHRARQDAKTKLLDAGTKLDRLESLLLSPPSKPILNIEDLVFRWQLLSEFRVRTAELAHILYTSTSAMKQGSCLDDDNDKVVNRTADRSKQDQTRPLFSKDSMDLMTRTCSNDFSSSLGKVCQACSWVLAATPLFFIMFVLVSIM